MPRDTKQLKPGHFSKQIKLLFSLSTVFFRLSDGSPNDETLWQKGVVKRFCHTFLPPNPIVGNPDFSPLSNDGILWQKVWQSRFATPFCHTILSLAFGERWKKGIVVRMSILIVDFLVLWQNHFATPFCHKDLSLEMMEKSGLPTIGFGGKGVWQNRFGTFCHQLSLETWKNKGFQR